MARIDIPEGNGKEVHRMWGLAPDLAVGMAAMSSSVYQKSSLPVREREAMRMRIAQLNQCHV